jgi:peptidoglycan/LPS O-acetylase OafA/YrhL
MSNILYDGFSSLGNNGVFSILIPFVLIFAIIFGILQKIKIFGDASKKFNLIIAFAIGMIVVAQHFYSPNSTYDVVPIINNAMGPVGLVLIGIISLLLILGVFGASVGLSDNKATGWIIGIAVIIVGWIFLSAAGFDVQWNLRGIIGPEIWSILIAVAVFIAIVAYITGEDKTGPAKPSVFEELAKLVSKK